MTKGRVYIGTYTEPILFGTGKVLQGKGEGIYLYAFDSATGSLEPQGLVARTINPSYLAIAPSGRFLYAVNELKEFEGAASGAVSAFAIEAESGGLTFLNQQATHGTDPCHLAVHPSGSHLLVANFMSGSVCVLPIRPDGSLSKTSDFVQHEGSSVDAVRQSGPHAHAVTLDEGGQTAFVPDLGLDRVLIYRFDAQTGKLLPHAQPWVGVAPGAGPRQLVLHPQGRYAYLINELDSTVTAFAYQADRGTLLEIQTLSTLPADYDGASTCAEIQIAPSGQFVYGSNRGHDSVVVYAVDGTSGRLTCLGQHSTGGKTPRHFALDPRGEYLVAANQDTEDLVVFRLDPASGKLVTTGQRVDAPTPVCVRFL